jgi:hypothetical protein
VDSKTALYKYIVSKNDINSTKEGILPPGRQGTIQRQLLEIFKFLF